MIAHSDRAMLHLIVLVTCASTVLGAAAPNVVGPENAPVDDGPALEDHPPRVALTEVVLQSFLEDAADVWQGPADEPTTYILGGNDAKPGAWPWQVSLRHKGKHCCGGVVIGPRWVLTSAGCFRELPAIPTVIVGLHDQRQAKDLPEYSVANATVHWAYDSASTPQHDLALLQLNEEVDFSTLTANAVVLPSADQNFPRTSTCFITGWGQISRFLTVLPNILQQAKVQIFDNYRCRRAWRWFGKQIYEGNICVGHYLRASSCAGDEGGPLVCKVAGNWQLAGVSSWTTPVCDSVLPSVYTRLTEYRQWIADVTGI